MCCPPVQLNCISGTFLQDIWIYSNNSSKQNSFLYFFFYVIMPEDSITGILDRFCPYTILYIQLYFTITNSFKSIASSTDWLYWRDRINSPPTFCFYDVQLKVIIIIFKEKIKFIEVYGFVTLYNLSSSLSPFPAYMDTYMHQFFMIQIKDLAVFNGDAYL